MLYVAFRPFMGMGERKCLICSSLSTLSKRCMPSLNISHWQHFEVFSNNLLLQLAQKKQQLNIFLKKQRPGIHIRVLDLVNK